MQSKHFLKAVLILLFWQPFLNNNTYGQIIEGGNKIRQSGQNHTLLFWEETKLEGKIILLSDDIIQFKTKEGAVKYIDRNKVAKIIIERKRKRKKESTVSNLGLGITPNAFNLKKREKRYENYYLVASSFSQGITDNISYSAGINMLWLFEGDLVVGGRIKITHPLTKNIHIGFTPSVVYDYLRKNEWTLTSIPTISVSIGQPTKYLNISVGRSFNKPSYVNKSETQDFFSVGGSIEINKTITILTDNIVVLKNNNDLVINYSPSLSLRIKSKKGFEFQGGLYTSIEHRYNFRTEVEFNAVPYVSFKLNL